MIRSGLVAFVIYLAGVSVVCAQAGSPPRQSSSSSSIDSLQPWSEYILTHLPETTPKELIRQKRIRNRFHRQGYPKVLTEVLKGDGLSAILSYIQMSFAVEFSMEHKTFWIIPPDPFSNVEGIPFPDDWSIPPDPWKREWWYEE